MVNPNKTAQLQIRVSAEQKAAIQYAASELNMDMSSYVLEKLLPQRYLKLQNLIDNLETDGNQRFVLAQINSLLSKFNPNEIKGLASIRLPNELSPYIKNYVAAMVEYSCNQHQVECPKWTRAISPLQLPIFSSSLQSLRLYLLTNSPPSFRRRNIFIDTTLGGQV